MPVIQPMLIAERDRISFSRTVGKRLLCSLLHQLLEGYIGGPSNPAVVPLQLVILCVLCDCVFLFKVTEIHI